MSGAHIAIVAAEKRRKERLQQQEEEMMTTYSSEDMDKWEFKIVRSATRLFHKPEVLGAVRDEESLAGWELLEKLDDKRLRFKRLKKAGQKDEFLPSGYDPYRTQIGRSEDQIGAFIFMGIIGLVTFAGLFIFLLNNASGAGDNPAIPIIAIAATIILIVFVFVAKWLRG